MRIEATDANTLYWRVLHDLLDIGHEASPRGLATKEVLGVQLVLTNPDANIVSHPWRRMQYPFSVAEWLWIMCGSNDTNLIVPYNRVLRTYANRFGTFDGAYGPKFVEQLPYVLETLEDDSHSRQAVISLWVPRPRESADTPCTLSFQFLLRENVDKTWWELHMVTTMRSNDAWLGLPYDLFNFTQIQRYVAHLLQVRVGTYTHNVGSLHLYERQWSEARSLVDWITPEILVTVGIPQSPPLTRMPDAFKAVFTGLTFMADEYSDSPNSVLDWIQPLQLAQPWQMYLELLAYRFHKQLELVPDPYQELIREQIPR
jgi:thymidylate synthase